MELSKAWPLPARWRGERGRGRRRRWLLAIAAGSALLLAAALGAASTGWLSLSPRAPAAHQTTLQEVLPVLGRSGVASQGVRVDVTYAPGLLFELTGQDPPEAPGLVFFLQESVHQGALPPAPPASEMRLEGGGTYGPLAVEVLQEDVHHRTSRLLFPVPAAGTRRVELVFPMEDGTVSSANRLRWLFPLELPGGGEVSLESPARIGSPPSEAGEGARRLSDLSRALRRTRSGVSYGGVGAIELGVTLATAEYFRAALPPETAARLVPERNAVMLVSETSHTTDLPADLPGLILRHAGASQPPDLVERKADSPHHRVTLVRFPVDLSAARGELELALPDGSAVRWELPIAYPSAGSASPFGLTWPSILAMLGGVLAAMWPCLFQLTVFFIPTLAGIGMDEAGGSVALGRRLQVLKAAIWFVLGFTLVYTAAGAVIGLAAQRLGETADFEAWQRIIGMGGGVVIFVLALRVAVRVRAPLVCKMPVLSRLSHRQGGPASPLELMLAGLAFATGCMTCFGAALVITMVVYVGLSGSVAFGALVMFVFSLGMGIPLVLAAMAMARVLPLLFRLERVLPWMGLASSLVMMGFAALLVSGRYMALTEWAYRTVGAGLP